MANKKALVGAGGLLALFGVRRRRRRRRSLREVATDVVEGAAADIGAPTADRDAEEVIEPVAGADDAHAPGHRHRGPPPGGRRRRRRRRGRSREVEGKSLHRRGR